MPNKEYREAEPFELETPQTEGSRHDPILRDFPANLFREDGVSTSAIPLGRVSPTNMDKPSVTAEHPLYEESEVHDLKFYIFLKSQKMCL